MDEFEPEFAGKMNFYLGLVDDTIKSKYDKSSIGLILCKTKKKVVAEYALRDTGKPIGIATYKINEALPSNIKSELPSIEALEQQLDEELKNTIVTTKTPLRAIKEKLKKRTKN